VGFHGDRIINVPSDHCDLYGDIHHEVHNQAGSTRMTVKDKNIKEKRKDPDRHYKCAYY